MPLTLIEGQFRIVNAAPDGDSIRFYPNARNAWRRIGKNVRTNRSGGAQLRLDGIDALETHYQPHARIYHSSISRSNWAEQRRQKCCAFAVSKR